MSHDHAIAIEPHEEIAHRSWRGPAIGSAILTVAWALYLVPVFFGILTATP